MKLRIRHIIIPTIGFALMACSDLPDDVLGKDEMVALLADVYKGESVLDYQRARYSTDSLKKVMKQSVYAKHGVTSAQVDSSLVWYGYHIEDYLEICDGVIARLEDELNAESGGGAPVFAEGDSVNVWSGARSYRLDKSVPVRNLVFSVENDGNFMAGDNYQLNFKIVNHRKSPMTFRSGVFAEYEDGELEYRTGNTSADGWQHIRLVTDSTKITDRVFGNIRFDVSDSEVIYVDSVSLVRTRLRPESYHRGSQRRINIKSQSDE